MKKLMLVVAVASLAACDSGERYESSGTVVDTVDTNATLNVPDVDVGLTNDTLSVPTFGTQKDTIIVDKPVVTGRKPVEVARPTVDVNKKP